jgi:hypothetical protein
MSAFPTEPAYTRPRIYSFMTGTRFLHVEDALLYNQPKIRFFAGEFKKNQGMKASAFHFLDLDDARVLFSDLAEGRVVDFIDFKGGMAADNSRVLSRVLKVNAKDGKIWIQLANGPGEKIAGGAVKPAGRPEAEIPVGLEMHEARKLGHAALAYLQAWEVVRMWKSMWKLKE